MPTLQIRKKTADIWEHIDSTGRKFVLSDFYVKSDVDGFQIVEIGGSQRVLYLISEVTVYDDTDAGAPETFANQVLLFQRLKDLGYPAFDQTGGGGGTIDQDNQLTPYKINIVKGIESSTSMAQKVATRINALPIFTVTEKQIPIFLVREFESDSDSTIASTSVWGLAYIGKGTYGTASGTILGLNDVVNLSPPVAPSQSTIPPDAVRITISGSGNPEDILNAVDPPIFINAASDTPTIITTDDGVYWWLGSEGTYGVGGDTAVAGDFQLLPNEIEYVTQDELSWTKTGDDIQNENVGNVKVKLNLAKQMQFLSETDVVVAYLNNQGDLYIKGLITAEPNKGISDGTGNLAIIYQLILGVKSWLVKRPMYYNADYSAEATPRMIMDKAYIDAAAASGGTLQTVTENGNTTTEKVGVGASVIDPTVTAMQVGDGETDDVNNLLVVSKEYTNSDNNNGINLRLAVNSTTGAASRNARAFKAKAYLDPDGNAMTNAGGACMGVEAAAYVIGDNGGSVTTVTSVYTRSINDSDNVTVEHLCGIFVNSNRGLANKSIGMYIVDLSTQLAAATNYTHLLIGAGNITDAPTGNYIIYSPKDWPSYFRGKIGVNVTVPTEAIDVSGNIKATGNFITSAVPTTGTHLTNKTYVDTGLALKANLSGGNTFAGDQVISDKLTIGSTPSAITGVTVGGSYALTQNAINAFLFENKSAGNAAEMRFIAKGNDASYVAFTQPGTGNTGTFFGAVKSTGSFIFNSAGGGTGRDLYLGTFSDKSLFFGTNNIARVQVSNAGVVSLLGSATIEVPTATTANQAVNKAQMDAADTLKANKVGADDIEITDATKGIILKDAGDGTRRRITVVNGVLTVSAPL